MSVIWSGITEEGAVVPVQVTEEGKVVAVGDGPQGDYLPITGGELTGDLQVDGDITAVGDIVGGPNPFASGSGYGVRFNSTGAYNFYRGAINIFNATGDNVIFLKSDGNAKFANGQTRISTNGSVTIGLLSATPNISLNSANGSAEFAGDKCGFTSDGELFFTSRGTRYKLFVSQGLVQAEEYTRQMELKEKAEQFIADKRETKPSEPQDGVTSDNDNA